MKNKDLFAEIRKALDNLTTSWYRDDKEAWLDVASKDILSKVLAAGYGKLETLADLKARAMKRPNLIITDESAGEKEETMENKDLLTEIAKELFDIWKEAKETTDDSWGNIQFDDLPEKHKHEYILTANRILSKVLVGEALIEEAKKQERERLLKYLKGILKA